jgi:hypothetical protein
MQVMRDDDRDARPDQAAHHRHHRAVTIRITGCRGCAVARDIDAIQLLRPGKPVLCAIEKIEKHRLLDRAARRRADHD